ncbi:hypothetical protein pb186bvf_001451 [Paramecium bursaria]
MSDVIIINFSGSQIQQVFLKRQQLKMLKILLIMILFIFGVFAQSTPCQLVCQSPYKKISAKPNHCCQGYWSQGQCVGQLVDPEPNSGKCLLDYQQ